MSERRVHTAFRHEVDARCSREAHPASERRVHTEYGDEVDARPRAGRDTEIPAVDEPCERDARHYPEYQDDRPRLEAAARHDLRVCRWRRPPGVARKVPRAAATRTWPPSRRRTRHRRDRPRGRRRAASRTARARLRRRPVRARTGPRRSPGLRAPPSRAADAACAAAVRGPAETGSSGASREPLPPRTERAVEIRPTEAFRDHPVCRVAEQRHGEDLPARALAGGSQAGLEAPDRRDVRGGSLPLAEIGGSGTRHRKSGSRLTAPIHAETAARTRSPHASMPQWMWSQWSARAKPRGSAGPSGSQQ